MSAAPSAILDETARKTVQAIFQGLSSVGQAKVAEALSVSEATVSRMKEDTPRYAAMLAKLGLKVVPVGYRCVAPKKMDALLTLAGLQIDQLREKPELVWEGDE